MARIFDGIPNDKILHFEIHYSTLFSAKIFIRRTQLQILRNASNELLNTYKISIDSQYDDGYPRRCGKS